MAPFELEFRPGPLPSACGVVKVAAQLSKPLSIHMTTMELAVAGEIATPEKFRPSSYSALKHVVSNN